MLIICQVKEKCVMLLAESIFLIWELNWKE
jgi:hypothetical protein